MLYYRLYKKMKKNFHFHSAITRSLDYVTFVVLIPISLGALLSDLFLTYFWKSDEMGVLITLLPMVIAALYIHLCEKHDKDKS
jgi:uncharacterized membrane protein (DUF485 family)